MSIRLLNLLLVSVALFGVNKAVKMTSPKAAQSICSSQSLFKTYPFFCKNSWMGWLIRRMSSERAVLDWRSVSSSIYSIRKYESFSIEWKCWLWRFFHCALRLKKSCQTHNFYYFSAVNILATRCSGVAVWIQKNKLEKSKHSDESSLSKVTWTPNLQARQA